MPADASAPRLLRATCVSSYLAPRFGGPPSVVAAHALALRAHASVTICGARPRDCDAASLMTPQARTLPTTWRPWEYAHGLDGLVRQAASAADILHSHDVWLHGLVATWRAARHHGVPFVLTPHGIFSAPWRYRSLHKRLYRRLILDRILRDCSCIHALNEMEAEGCRTAGLGVPVRIIPNGLPAAVYDAPGDPTAFLDRYPALRHRRIALYLGRVWSGKGLDILPEAWAAAAERDWVLVIAGPDYRGYSGQVETRIRELGVADRVLMTGPIYDDLKTSMLTAAHCFILPSHGEGFSMSALEAMAARLPCILTRACNFPELVAAGAGWECADTAADLGTAIATATRTDAAALMRMGRAGWELGRSHYTLDQVGAGLIDMYRDCIAAGFGRQVRSC